MESIAESSNEDSKDESKNDSNEDSHEKLDDSNGPHLRYMLPPIAVKPPNSNREFLKNLALIEEKVITHDLAERTTGNSPLPVSFTRSLSNLPTTTAVRNRKNTKVKIKVGM